MTSQTVSKALSHSFRPDHTITRTLFSLLLTLHGLVLSNRISACSCMGVGGPHSLMEECAGQSNVNARHDDFPMKRLVLLTQLSGTQGYYPLK